MTELLSRLAECLVGTPLHERLAPHAGPFLERRGRDPSLASLAGQELRGLARLLACSAEAARYLSIRPTLVERLAVVGPSTLEVRAAELARTDSPAPLADLEAYLDALRLVRRDETVLAACLQMGGQVDFEQVSVFLSIVAETCLRWGLLAAYPKPGDTASSALGIVGMGKIAGREFSYASDLDLIFLVGDEVPEITEPSRVARRLIAYLTSMTGAGVVYAVDSRLRPSGGQGTLVSTFKSFERYQLERAQTWEHLALMRARAIAGDVEAAEDVLQATRAAVLGRGHSPWREVADMRARVERERGQEELGTVALKAGRGGLMDVEFLAGGALLERGAALEAGALPNVPALLRSAAPGPALEALLAEYGFLRRVEGCARFIAARALESVRISGDGAPVLAEIVEPGTSPGELAERIEGARGVIRRGYDAVIRAGSIAALAS
ncbi:MAG: hypothetical protein V3V67_03950 [Myxococcota bacterium]